MTLVLSVRGRDTAWLVVDRRLWYGPRRAPVDTAVKVAQLETTDGVGLLAYAGLGATVRGTQPSEWMSAVLRGRHGVTFEQALSVLSDAANRELPTHLKALPAVGDPIVGHSIIVPAFVRGIGFRLYTIDNVVNRRTGERRYRYTSHQPTEKRGPPSGYFTFGGTGGIHLASRQDQSWRRPLRRLVKAHDRGKISDRVIADHLARLNYEAYQEVRDGTVGPRCIVVWCRRRDARPGPLGGGHLFYTGIDCERDICPIPSIANGMDVQGLLGVLTPLIQGRVANHRIRGAFDFDHDELNRRVGELPGEPDERLR